MFEQRNLKLDLAALAMLAVVAFLAVALATYNPADPPGTAVYPAPDAVSNACGRLGAWVAAQLFAGFGIGAYYLAVSLAALDVALLARRKIGEPVLRMVGWTLSLVALATLASLALPSLSPGPAIGPGGYLGAAGRGLLESHFASAGAYILTISVLFGGLLLCTDYVLLKLSVLVVGAPVKRVAAASRLTGRAPASQAAGKKLAAANKTRGKSDLDDPLAAKSDEEASDDEPVAIKFPGKAAKNGDTADELEDEELLDEDYDETEEDQDDVDDEQTDVERPLASALKIRAPVQRKDERQKVIEQLEEGSKPAEAADYQLPSVELLLEGEEFPFETHEKEVRTTAKLLERTFLNFGFNVKVVEIQTGPVIAQYEIELEKGLRLAKITNLADDIAIALRVPSVRIVAPIPGKNTVGIEVPNGERQIVRLREIIEEASAAATKMKIPIFLGKDVSGHPMTIDLATLPHLLIAGRTGTGKSVCLNSIIVSMLMTRRPDEVRMLMIDPKMVELSPYQRLPHLMHPVVTDMAKAAAILEWAVEKMEERYSLLARAGVRHISNYNQLGEEELMERLQPENDEERAAIPRSLPYIVIVADEMADLMMTSGKEVEQFIIRLAQKSRAVGIHLILATQKPTVDVITGLIKSNLPARIAFQVASRTDSRVVLDEMGADKLLGNGDFLFLWPGTSQLHRGQGTYLTDDEINGVVRVVGQHQPNFVKELVQLKPKDGAGGGAGTFRRRDDLYERAVDTVVREGRGSVSLLQRTLGIGYGRAARLIDFMAEDNIVGAYNGAQAREVLISIAEWERMQADSHEEEQPKARRRNGRSAIRMDRYEDETDLPDSPPALPAPTPAVVVSPTAKRRPIKMQDEDEEDTVDEEEDSLDDEAPFDDEADNETDDEEDDVEDDVEDDELEDDDIDEDYDDEAEEDDADEDDEETDTAELDEEIEQQSPVRAKRKPRDKPDDRRPPDPTPHSPRRGSRTRTA
ncbi:MAG: DNA translocase FtsK [Pirellulales bacterium]